MIKLIASDMDGTLLDENAQVPEETYELIRKLRARGVSFAASSGRRYDTLCEFFAPVVDDMDFVASNGCQVYVDGVMVDREVYSHAAIKRLERTVLKFDCLHLVLFDRTSSFLYDDTDVYEREIDKDLPAPRRIYETPGPQVNIIKASVYCDDATKTWDMAYALGRELADTFVMAPSGTKWIDVLFPPAAMGSIVAIIGLELAPLAMNMSGYMGEVQGMSNETAMIISTFTLVVTILATVLGRGFIGIIPILIGVIAGYILSFFMGVVDWTHVQEMPWFAVPTFYKPEFNLSAIMMIMPALFVVLAEHLGHLFVTSDIVGRDLIKDPGLHRSLFADGLSNVLSGLVGSTPNTTYGENMGVMAITGVYSTWVIGGAAVFAILFSFIGKIAALIHAIPTPVMGGVCILLFGFIAASGLRMLVEKKVDYTRSKNLILTAVTMISGLSGATIILGPVQLKGMGLATVVAMVMSLVFLFFEKIHWANE